MPANNLPLIYRTPPRWAIEVLREPLQLLDDHAHLEKKAAANALELLNRWPAAGCAAHWVAALAAVARDETDHLAAVCRLLQRRGGCLGRRHSNAYASDLRQLVRAGQGRAELADRLLVSALIEARSCERFLLLADVAAESDLARLYRGLWSSEHGHYLTFIQLAHHAISEQETALRWQELLVAESTIIQRQPPGFRLHGGLMHGVD